MNNVLVLLTMVFLHIVADYNLQDILASMKQKKYWEDEMSKMGMSQNAKDKYKYDYIVALLTHSFAWTFLMMLPMLFINGMSILFLILFGINLILHTAIDDLKANKFKINLIEDQLLHLVQIVITWALFCLL
jgi:hypothetical protein